MHATSERWQTLGTHGGSLVGFLAFVVYGAVPGLLYGNHMGMLMLRALFGAHGEPGAAAAQEPDLLARIVTGGGMVLGLLASLFLFLVIGAVMGTAIGALTALLLPHSRRPR